MNTKKQIKKLKHRIAALEAVLSIETTEAWAGETRVLTIETPKLDLDQAKQIIERISQKGGHP